MTPSLLYKISTGGRLGAAPGRAAAVVLSLIIAHSACRAGETPGSFVRRYSGSIGPYPFQMTLERQGPRVTGSYRYVRAGVSLRLEGTWDGDRARIRELFAGTTRTASITARSFGDGSLEGTWTKRDNGRTLPFRARLISDIGRADVHIRHGGTSETSVPAIKAHRQSTVGSTRRQRTANTNIASQDSGDVGDRMLQAVRKGDTGTARALMERHPDLDPRDSQGHSLLMLACTFRNDASEETSFASMEERQEFVKLLLDRNVNVDARDKRGYTALMYAAASWGAGNPIVRLLLEAGANVNARNLYQGTALMVATGKYGHVRTVQLLLDAGADVNLQDKFGHTALWHARSHRASASARELERAGGVE